MRVVGRVLLKSTLSCSSVVAVSSPPLCPVQAVTEAAASITNTVAELQRKLPVAQPTPTESVLSLPVVISKTYSPAEGESEASAEIERIRHEIERIKSRAAETLQRNAAPHELRVCAAYTQYVWSVFIVFTK